MPPTLIVNPNASTISTRRIRELEERLGVVETLFTERKGHATELARAAQGDAVFAYGGDGLVNEVVNGLPPEKPLGIVPGGHTNVFARALGVPKDPARATRERRISVGRANGRRFAFAAGVGVDADAVRELDTIKRSRRGKRPGDLAYAKVVAGRLLRGYEQRLEVEGHGRAAMVFATNDSVFTYVGPRALRLSRRARFELGLDLIATERATRTVTGRWVPRLLLGRGLEGVAGVTVLHDVDSVRVVCDLPLPLQVDGEDLGDVAEVLFECERAALVVLV